MKSILFTKTNIMACLFLYIEISTAIYLEGNGI